MMILMYGDVLETTTILGWLLPNMIQFFPSRPGTGDDKPSPKKFLPLQKLTFVDQSTLLEEDPSRGGPMIPPPLS